MNSQVLVAGSGALFGLMLIFALLTRLGGVSMGNRLLAGSLAGALSYLVGLMMIRAEWSQGQGLVRLLVALYLLSPVFMLGYVRSLIRPDFQLRPSNLIHLLPAVGFYVALAFLLDDNIATMDALEKARGGWPPNQTSLVGIVMYLIQVGYFSRALLELQAHRRQIAWDFSYEENITLRWLRVLLGISLLLSSVGLLIALLRLHPEVELWPRSIYSMSVVLVVYYLIGFMGLSQPAIFDPVVARAGRAVSGDTGEGGTVDPAKVPQESDSGIVPKEVEAHYWNALQAHMLEEKPFLDAQLRIADLARQLDMPVHHLSQTINRCAGESFSDFINRYRVNEAKTLLEEGEKPVSAITFDDGFNSQSACYRHFKNFTGQTPKQYQRGLSPRSAS